MEFFHPHSRRSPRFSIPASHPHSIRAQPASPSGQATLEILLAFAELLLVLQRLVFLARFGHEQALGFSDAQTRQLLAQKSLVLGVLCSDGENSSLNISTSHPASINGTGRLLTNPDRTVSVMILPRIGPSRAGASID